MDGGTREEREKVATVHCSIRNEEETKSGTKYKQKKLLANTEGVTAGTQKWRGENMTSIFN